MSKITTLYVIGDKYSLIVCCVFNILFKKKLLIAYPFVVIEQG